MSRLGKLVVTLGWTLGVPDATLGAVFERLDTCARTDTAGMRRFLRWNEVLLASRRQNPVLISVAASGPLLSVSILLAAPIPPGCVVFFDEMRCFWLHDAKIPF